MHISVFVFFSLLYIVAAVSPSTTLPASADVFFWPVASPQPSLLARIAYDPSTLETSVLSYNPPDDANRTPVGEDGGAEDLIRIGFFVSTPSNSKQWVGSLISRSSLVGEVITDDPSRPKLQLHLSPANELYHVSLSLPSKQNSSSTLDVDLVHADAGPRPHLNKPVVVGPDGKDTEEVVEKTFFQKYWWIFLIVTFLAMSGGGEGQR
ncbi:hypothetical protein VTN77DRAFT_8523 [Rasamsonia byssochlamydoides]|uniref:uncharacterized protein n=1 Tax=Rasamsonia byssochlamydoides TaxID=89139 RepID=UPI0037431A4A